MARTIAEHLVDTLARAGVRQIYGVVGDSLAVQAALEQRFTLRAFHTPPRKSCRDGAGGPTLPDGLGAARS